MPSSNQTRRWPGRRPRRHRGPLLRTARPVRLGSAPARRGAAFTSQKREAAMPLFGNQQQDQGSAVWEPKAADTRLAHTAGASPSGVFTSDLSVSEYVLLGEAGFEPLGFVVGSSIYHVGLQAGRWNQNQELTLLT